uniref:CSON013147 protein n=1 Tax=Culicoides sonorensis TaxID=179676 RepID=A0A336M9Z9_CULSO
MVYERRKRNSKQIHECLPDDLTNTQNLICVFDDILFAWDSKHCCVLTLNWRLNHAKEPNSVKYQV